MGLFSRKNTPPSLVTVHFINAQTGETLGIDDLRPEDLPSSFSPNMTLHIGGTDWSVAEAIPQNAEDFRKSGQLTLKLHKIESMNPKDILFSLPSISKELAESVPNTPFSDFNTVLHADEWRQSEFLHPSKKELMDSEVAKVQEIWDNHKVDTASDFAGFNRCHMRDTIGEPALQLSFSQLKSLLGTQSVGSVKFEDETGFVENGFSLKTEHSAFYGTLAGDTVTLLGISEYSGDSLPEINKLVGETGSIFIRWYDGQFILPEN
jgi:hypothetical protein